MQTTPQLTLAGELFPAAGTLTKVAAALVASIVIAVSAQPTIEIGPVPLTLQTLTVLLTGALLGSRLGALAIVFYFAEALMGLPVFAGGASAWTPTRLGLPTIIGPTIGYAFGFIPSAFVVGWLAERGWSRNVLLTALSMVIGNVIIYAFGLLNLARIVPLPGLLAAGLFPFLAGDAIKIAAAVVLLPGSWKLTQSLGFPSRGGEGNKPGRA